MKVVCQRSSDLCQVESAGPSVQQADARQHEESPDTVGYAEVDRALQRRFLFDFVTGKRIRHRAHQLEEDEHVEQVAAQGERYHRGEKDQHQGVVNRADAVQVTPGKNHRREHQQRDESCQSGAHGIDHETDTHREAANRMPVAEPVHERPMERAIEQDQGKRGDRRRCPDRGRVGEHARYQPGKPDEYRRYEQR
jgi:hypothetical protein